MSSQPIRRGRGRIRSERIVGGGATARKRAGRYWSSSRQMSSVAASDPPSSPCPATCTTSALRSTHSACRRPRCRSTRSARTACVGCGRRFHSPTRSTAGAPVCSTAASTTPQPASGPTDRRGNDCSGRSSGTGRSCSRNCSDRSCPSRATRSRWPGSASTPSSRPRGWRSGSTPRRLQRSSVAVRPTRSCP